MAHYEETAEEIWNQCDGKIDYCFIGAGTGGTLTGISRKLKEKDPNIKIISIDPNGSILAEPQQLNDENPPDEGGQQVEGIGYDFLPRVIDRTYTDEWMKCADKESYLMARRLLREEGMLCGGSSGSAMYCAIDYIKKHNIGAGKRCVVILPDNIRNYLSKHLNMDWMYERNYVTEQECAQAFVSDLVPNTDWGQDITVGTLELPAAVFVEDTTTVEDLVAKFCTLGFAQFPVKRSTDGKIIGVVTKADVTGKLVKKRVTLKDNIKTLVQRELRHVSNEITLNELGRILTRNKFALVDKTKFVTSSDLLKEVVGKTGASAAIAKSSVQPQNKPQDANGDDQQSSLMMKVGLTAALGMTAAAAFVFTQKKQ